MSCPRLYFKNVPLFVKSVPTLTTRDLFFPSKNTLSTLQPLTKYLFLILFQIQVPSGSPRSTAGQKVKKSLD